MIKKGKKAVEEKEGAKNGMGKEEGKDGNRKERDEGLLLYKRKKVGR